jgi:histidinol-phosphate aminotransferase
MFIQGNGDSKELNLNSRTKAEMKHKEWIDTVERVRGTTETRLNKVRLDKNERLGYFYNSFWNKIISKITQEHIFAYPEIEPLYNKLASFLGVTIDNLVITAGSDFAIKIVFELFINPGDSVVVLNPTFAMVNVYCDLYKAKRIDIGYDEKLNLDVDTLLNSIDEKVALVIIANPNSPTGTYINNNTLKIILQKASNFSIPVFVDEAYYGFCPFSAMDLLENHDNLIITRTFSKTAGLAGLRIGYIIADKKLAQLLYKFKPMYEINSIAVLFASELLDNWTLVDEYISDTDEGKKYLIKELEVLSYDVVDTFANFIHVDFKSKKDRILKGFEDDGILVRGGIGVRGFEGYTRISVGSIDKMKKVMDSILKNIL